MWGEDIQEGEVILEELNEGTVLSVRDGIVTADGLLDAEVGELIRFEPIRELELFLLRDDSELFSGDEFIYGIVLNLNLNSVSIVLLGSDADIYEGMSCSRTGRLLSIPTGWFAIGQVLDAKGDPCMTEDDFDEFNEREFEDEEDQGLPYFYVERKAPGIKFREPVNEPVLTGLKVIDSLIPIGRGQRELIIGDRQTGKTTIAIDTIINQVNFFDSYPETFISDTVECTDTNRNICIYVAIGQKRSTVAKIIYLLKEQKALSHSIIIAATASDSAAMQYIAPYSACTFGEYFSLLGVSSIIVYDDLSKHANAYRQISLLLRRPPGREAYPGDIFYLHSRLLERSFKLGKLYGGGSVTALPIIETQAGDVSAYIPTNVISITDGQIFLETELFYKGIRPAVNPGLSVSRVGSAAQKKIMKKVAGSLKLELAQYREISGFAKFASSLDDSTKRLLRRGELLSELLKQKPHVPLELGEQVAQMYPVLGGFVDKLMANELLKFVKQFANFVKKIFFTFGRVMHTNLSFTFKVLNKLIGIYFSFGYIRS